QGPRVKKALAEVVASLQAESAAAASESKPISVDDSVVAVTNGSDLPAAPREPIVTASTPAVPSRGDGGASLGQVPPAPRTSDIRYNTVKTFSWDQGSYNSPKISVYVPLQGVGTAKDRVSCSFDTRGFDLKVTGLESKNYRLIQNNLEKDIVPEESKCLVKKDKVILKLQKTKLSYGGYEHWNDLAAKKAKKTDKSNPQGALMDMMKDMYDDGDDNMKKIIGEAMMKSRQNEGGKPDPYNPPSYDSGRKGGLGNFDDMDDLDFDKGVGDDGWGKGGEDDFGFGSKAPPPQASEPVPAAVEDDEGEAGAG
ncbi:unnamed protein product, partial [Ascophyllum nodosum]